MLETHNKQLASYGVIFQSDVRSYFKTPVCGAPFFVFQEKESPDAENSQFFCLKSDSNFANIILFCL